jgi:endonuclease/exonuclease/phosphatase family metal-dependent hydrolase
MEALAHALAHGTHHDVYDGHYFPAHDYPLTERTSVYTTGLAILVRRPLKLHRHNAASPFEITHRKSPLRTHATARAIRGWKKQTRICAHAVFEHPTGGTIDLFNTHLSLPNFATPEFWTGEERLGHGANQLEEARQLVSFVARERSSDRFLVMGDFNALPGSPVYEVLTREAGWADPLRASLGSLEALRQFPTAGFLRMRMHLDHLLSGPGIAWKDVDGSRPFGDRESPFHGLSDHTPLIGRFSTDPTCTIDGTGPS